MESIKEIEEFFKTAISDFKRMDNEQRKDLLIGGATLLGAMILPFFI